MFNSSNAIIITSSITSSTAGGDGGSCSGFNLTGLQFHCYSRLD